MKNCPKCGSPITDNTNKCFMCGADITGHSTIQAVTDDGFADNFFAQLGGVATTSQDSVIEDNNVNVDANQVSNKANLSEQNVLVVDNENNKTESFNSILGSYLTNENDGFHSAEKQVQQNVQMQEQAQQENQNEKKKMFVITKEKNVGNKIANGVGQVNAENNAMQASTPSANVNPFTQADSVGAVNTVLQEAQIQQPVQVEPVKIAPLQPQKIEIKDDEEIYSVPLQPRIKGPNQLLQFIQKNKSFVFNAMCFIGFLVIVVVVYFGFIKKDTDTHTRLGGLTYDLSTEFTLTNLHDGGKYYSYNNDACEVRVMYGAANSDGFIDSRFNTIRESYKDNPNYQFQNDELKINNNKWSSLSVIEMPNGSTTAPTLRFKSVMIVHKAEVYTINFSNQDNDQQCLFMFNNFMDTLNFD